MSMNVKKGDAVKIIAGSDKGKTAQVLAVDTKSSRVVLKGDGLKTVKCFVKPRNAQEKGGVIEREPSINVSNVMILCPSCNATTRIAHSITVDENGKKVKNRICKKCGASLDVKAAKAAKTVKTVKKAAKKAASAKEASEDTAVKETKKKPTATKAKKTVSAQEN